MDSHVPSNRNESWTDEKHEHFLNSMEACFVHTMLESKDRYNLCLDRRPPDSFESTLDCKRNIQTRKKYATSDFFVTTRNKVKGRPNKSPRSTSQPLNSSQDQVVPQIEIRKGDRDEKDLPIVPVESMAPAN